MYYRHLFALFLCLILAVGAQASPVTWNQVSSGPTLYFGFDKAATNSSVSVSTNDDGIPPEFVRLPDGRLVPFGPGVLCLQSESDEAVTHHSRKWLIAIPIITAVVACAVLCRSNDRPREPRTNCVTGPCTPDSTPTPTPTPGTTPTPTPTPGATPTPTPTPGTTPTPTPTPGVTPTPTPGSTPTPEPPPRSTPPPDTPPTPVPEPGTLLLVGAGLALAARKGLKKNKKDDK